VGAGRGGEGGREGGVVGREREGGVVWVICDEGGHEGEERRRMKRGRQRVEAERKRCNEHTKKMSPELDSITTKEQIHYTQRRAV